jgi:hypothetical protein
VLVAAVQNARQFYDDAATVIPVLLLAVIYQSTSLHPAPGVGLLALMGIAIVALVLAALGEFECLHVAAGYRPTFGGLGVVTLALATLGTLSLIDPIYRISKAWTASPVKAPTLSLRKHKGYRAFFIAIGVVVALILIGILILSASGKPT